MKRAGLNETIVDGDMITVDATAIIVTEPIVDQAVSDVYIAASYS